MNKKCIWICCIAVSAGICVSMWALFLYSPTGMSFPDSHPDPKATDPSVDHAAEESRQLRYGFAVQNTTGRVVPKALLHVYAPVRKTATQRVEAIESSHPYQLTQDCLGNQVLSFHLTDIPPYGSRIINIKADLSISHKPKHESRPLHEEWFLSPEPHVESDHPIITRRADALKQESPKDTAEAIFRWVAGHIEYSGYQRRAHGALRALSLAKGDCTEYMDLFAALSRAANIASRRAGGYVVSKNSVLSPSGYHNWAEFYLDGRWHVADPQRGMFMDDSGDYIPMRIISEHCQTPMKHYSQYRVEGDGVRVTMTP